MQPACSAEWPNALFDALQHLTCRRRAASALTNAHADQPVPNVESSCSQVFSCAAIVHLSTLLPPCDAAGLLSIMGW
ncbi:hypothetical protein WJX74_010417 [Apatococcus lobatus]|uniref:Uncharacterized protein n=1 Tax=Apatococcus lobatus TaxID=904363 RepID=A0AAW1QCQ7_9CHLO